MRLSLLIIIVLCLVPHTGFGQDRPTTSSVDAATYALWANQDWDTLISTGNEALKQGLDFYYLRYRLGVAWYEKRNYHQAIRHFQAACRMSAEDDVLKEYLYYSYVYSGREYEAAYLDDTFSTRLRNKLNLADNSLKQAYIAYSYHPGATSSTTAQFDLSTDAEGYQTITTGYHLVNIGLEHRVGSRFWLQHSYTHLQRNYFQYYNIGNTSLLNQDDKTYVNQYYLGTTALIKPGLDIRFGFHYIHLLNYMSSTIPAPGRPGAFSEPVTNVNFVGFVSLYRRYRYLTAGLSSNIGNVNDATQFQQDAMIALFPFGNLNLYTTSTLSLQTEKMVDKNWRDELIFHQNIGMKLSDRIWAEAEASFGEIMNVITYDGSVIFNDTDVIKQKYGLSLHTIITPRIHLRLNYVYYKKESSFVPSQTGFQVPETIPYSTNSITAVVIWKR